MPPNEIPLDAIVFIVPMGFAPRLLLEEKLAFARYEQMTDVVQGTFCP